MGDIAMTVPIIYSLSYQYPKTKITIVSKPFANTFFCTMPPNVKFIGVDLKHKYKGVKGLYNLFKFLYQIHPTAIADLHDVLRTKFLRLCFRIKGIKVAHINKHKQGKRNLCKKHHKILKQQPTSFSNYIDVIKKIGYNITPIFNSIYQNSNTATIIADNNLPIKTKNEIWVGIAPFAAHKWKTYPVNKMKNAIKILIERNPQIKIFLFGGGAKEEEILENWSNEYHNCINVPSITNGLNQELLLMSELNLMISMDSANMHLASLVNTRVLSIWGATHPYCGFLGWKQNKNDTIQNKDLKCRPCSVFGNKTCYRGDFACMESINANMLVDEIELSLIHI